jgi:hypothetical protein
MDDGIQALGAVFRPEAFVGGRGITISSLVLCACTPHHAVVQQESARHVPQPTRSFAVQKNVSNAVVHGDLKNWNVGVSR